MIKTYDPKQVSIIVGTRQITGIDRSTFVTVRFNSDAWTAQVGADGEGVRSKSNDFSGQIEIVTMQSSTENDFLSELAIADRVANGGVVPVLVKDVLGNSLHAAESAWIKKTPDAAYGAESGSRTWVMETTDLRSFIGQSATE